MAREKAGDCQQAQTTYDFNVCFGGSATAADQSLKQYEDAIRGLLSLNDPALAGQLPMQGPAGPQLKPEQLAAEFDQVEKNWHAHLDTASTAAFHQFGGGSGGPSFEMQTHLQLVRSTSGNWTRSTACCCVFDSQ